MRTDQKSKTFQLGAYTLYAARMIKATPIVLYLLCFIGICSASSIFLEGTRLFWPLTAFVIVVSTVATPIIYGIFYQLIEDCYSSISDIAATFILPYLYLLIRMYFPAVFAASLLVVTLPGNHSGIFEITLIFFSLLYTYVIPMFFISKTQQGAITKGVAFLFQNLAPSAPIILVVLLLETIMLLFQISKPGLAEHGTFLLGILDFVIFLSVSVLDCAVFIVLIFVLKNTAHNRDG